jgi:carbon monoxide dehydrogenase subunit G
MKLEQSFEVQAPLDQVWQALIDVERVAPCLPGAAVTGRNDDGTFAGTFSVKVGPTSASYSGKLEMRDVDDTAHTATMYAQGSDKRGQGGATATIVSTLAEIDPNRTRVEVSTDYRITGRLARFGRGGMIEDISQKLLRRFADCLQASLAGGPSSAASAPAGDGESAAESAAGNGSEAGQPAATDATLGSAPPAPPAPGPSAEPLSGLSLIGGIVSDRIRANPAPVIVAAAVLLLLVRRARR